MAKTSLAGMVTSRLLDVEKDGSFPNWFKMGNSFEFKCDQVKDSFSFNDSAAWTNNMKLRTWTNIQRLKVIRDKKAHLWMYWFGEKIAKELLGYTKVGDYITRPLALKLGNKAVRVQAIFQISQQRFSSGRNVKLNVTMAGTMD